MTGPEIEHHAVRVINEAQTVVALVTPYFTPWEHLRFAIENARVRNVEVILILRGGDTEKQNRETAVYYTQRGVKVALLERLHAKLYISEKTAMVTSMNLVSASASGSWEIAATAHKEEDPEAYKELTRCFNEILAQVNLAALRSKLAAPGAAPHVAPRPAGSKPTSALVPTAPIARAPTVKAPTVKAPATPKRAATRFGSCIRCADPVPANPERPLCKECYTAWAKYENPAYEEKYCHGCAKKTPTSFTKPLCRPCYAAS
ncbi:MAG: phospholipase D-like domain-containing protein [Myxococcota bacterium]